MFILSACKGLAALKDSLLAELYPRIRKHLRVDVTSPHQSAGIAPAGSTFTAGGELLTSNMPTVGGLLVRKTDGGGRLAASAENRHVFKAPESATRTSLLGLDRLAEAKRDEAAAAGLTKRTSGLREGS